MKPLDRLVWVDLETTGLDPEKDVILEIGIVITDSRLRELASIQWLVRPAAGLPALSPEVFEMHARNGLLCMIAEGSPLIDVDDGASTIIAGHLAAGGPICGSTPSFDRAFIHRHMPKLDSCFNHRCFDVSTLKQVWCQNTGQEWPKIKPAHRALADVRESIAAAKQLIKR